MKSLGRVAIYARFSTDKQSDASIEDQVRVASALVTREGGASTTEVFSDFGVCGKDLKRTGVQALLAEIRKGGFDTLVTEAVDRIARDEEDAHHIRKLCAKHKVALICVDGTRLDSDNHAGRLLFTFKASFAEEFRHQLSAKTKRGKDGVALKGLSNGNLPYGYASDAGGRISIDDEEAAIVRRVFSEVSRGKAMSRVARALNAEAVPTPRRGKPWTFSTLQVVLRCHKYIGDWSYTTVVKTARPELAIIERELFAAVAAVLSKRKGRTYTTGRQAHLLSGILFCASCGARMVSAGGFQGTSYFGCAAARLHGGCGNTRKIKLNVLQSELLQAVKTTLQHSRGVIAKLAAEELAAWKAAHRARPGDKAAKELRTAEQQLENLVDGLASLGNSAAVTKKIAAAEARVQTLRAQVAAGVAPAPEAPSVDALVGKVMNLEALVRSNDTDIARTQLRRLLKGERVLAKPTEKGFKISCDLVFDTQEYVLAGSHESRVVLPIRFTVTPKWRQGPLPRRRR